MLYASFPDASELLLLTGPFRTRMRWKEYCEECMVFKPYALITTFT